MAQVEGGAASRFLDAFQKVTVRGRDAAGRDHVLEVWVSPDYPTAPERRRAIHSDSGRLSRFSLECDPRGLHFPFARRDSRKQETAATGLKGEARAGTGSV